MENGLRLLPNPTLMMCPSGNVPSREGVRTMNENSQGPVVRKTNNRNSTGCTVRAVHVATAADAVRAGRIARAANAVRVGSPRVANVVRVGCAVNMKPRNQGCGTMKKTIGPAGCLVRCVAAHACPATSMSS